MKKIYIDMDGVVADFDTWVSDFLGRKISWFTHDMTREEWTRLATQQHMYLDLPLMPDCTKLVGYCANLVTKFNAQFLTALPKEHHMPYAREDKIVWAAKYFPGYKVNFGPRSQDKWTWSKPGAGDILIDDKLSNINDWYTKGKGIAIQHRGNVDETIKHLDDLINVKEPRKISYE